MYVAPRTQTHLGLWLGPARLITNALNSQQTGPMVGQSLSRRGLPLSSLTTFTFQKETKLDCTGRRYIKQQHKLLLIMGLLRLSQPCAAFQQANWVKKSRYPMNSSVCTSSPWANNGGKRRRHVLPALSPTDVAEMRRRRALGDAVKRLARDFCVSVSTASEAIRGKRTYKSHQ